MLVRLAQRAKVSKDNLEVRTYVQKYPLKMSCTVLITAKKEDSVTIGKWLS